MTAVPRIIESRAWLESPAGRYLLAWEQAQLDRVVSDVFGFHALQVGRPALDALRANRMPHRWMLDDVPQAAGAASRPLDILAQFEALPLPSQSLDLVVLAHTLELAEDAHQTLREVERVLMPEGRVVVVGFNPTSLWGVAGHCSRTASRLGLRAPQHERGEIIGPRRLRDWLKLLGLQVETGCFGCYRPTWSTERWLDRTEWMEAAGQRWWPFFGSLYMVVAVKRVHAMRLIGPAWKRRMQVGAVTAPAVLTPQRQQVSSTLAQATVAADSGLPPQAGASLHPDPK
jgi:SAM-dependent methyltransferase